MLAVAMQTLLRHSVFFLLAATAGCASRVEPSLSDAALEASASDAMVLAPPFVSAPPSTGPYALCGAVGLGTIAAVEFAPSLGAIAVGTFAGFVRLVDANDGHNLGLIFAHSYGLASMSISPDQTLLATAGSDFESRDVRLWSARDGAAVRSITLESDPIAVAFVPDGSAIIVTQRNAVSRYRVRDGEREWSVAQVGRPIEASAVSPDGSAVAYLSDTGISLLRASDGAAGPRVTDSFMRNRRAIAFARDSSSLVVGYQYHSTEGPETPEVIARVIDIATSATQVEIEGTSSVNALRVAPSGDEVAIAFLHVGYERWAIRGDGAWLPRGQRRAALTIEQESRAIAFDREGRRLVVASADAVRTFDATTSAAPTSAFDVVAVLQGVLGLGGGGSVELSEDGRELVVGTRDSVYLFSTETQDVLRRFDQTRGVGAISPDGQTIVTGASGGRVSLWRRGDWSSREVATVAELASLAFVDGARFVAGGRDALALHAVADGAEQRRWARSRRQQPTFDLRLSRDSSLIAASTFGGFGGGLDVLDLRSGEAVFSVEGNFRSRSNSAFLRDGRLLVAMGRGAALELHSGAGMRSLLSGPGSPVTTVALSSDEGLLLTSTSDGTTRIQRGLTGEAVQSLGRIGPSATSLGNVLRISSDSSRIVRTGAQGTLQLWCRR
jgi:WD40 repeat protein